MGNKETFAYWILEREFVRKAKEAGMAKPWSEDRVFQETYFCNVRREDDRVTKWIRQRFNEYGAEDPAIPNMMMARMVNKTTSLEALGFPWGVWLPEHWRDVMSRKGAWGSAYIVSTNGRPVPKHEYVQGLLEQAWQRFAGVGAATLPPTCAAHHKAIQGLSGMGSFMSAQVVADLKNTAGHPLQNATDFKTFASHGPGSLRGLAWFHGVDRLVPSKFSAALASARQWCYSDTSVASIVEGLCNQDLQNCFCEYDKYMRVNNGKGRSKRKYPGRF